MHPRTPTILRGLAIFFWSCALIVLGYSEVKEAPRAPLFGFFAIAGAMFAIGWFNAFIHDREAAARAAAGAARAAAKPRHTPTEESPDPASSNEATIAFARLNAHIVRPVPRIYITHPAPAPRPPAAEEMLPVTEVDIAHTLASVYSAGHRNGYDEGFGDATGIAPPCGFDELSTGGHRRRETDDH